MEELVELLEVGSWVARIVLQHEFHQQAVGQH